MARMKENQVSFAEIERAYLDLRLKTEEFLNNAPAFPGNIGKITAIGRSMFNMETLLNKMRK